MRILMLALIAVLIFFQYKLWVEKQGLAQVVRLQQQLAEITEKNTELEKQNAQLQSKVESYKKGVGSYEGRAREDLGMVKHGETYYQVVPKKQTNSCSIPTHTEQGTKQSQVEKAIGAAQ